MEIKCQLDSTDDFYCRSYCFLNMFRAPLRPSSGAREYYTGGCCLCCLVLWFSGCWYGVEMRVMCPVCGQPLCPSSGPREYYTGCCCLWYLVLWFSICRSCSSPQTGHITLSSTPYRQIEDQSTKYHRQQPSL